MIIHNTRYFVPPQEWLNWFFHDGNESRLTRDVIDMSHQQKPKGWNCDQLSGRKYEALASLTTCLKVCSLEKVKIKVKGNRGSSAIKDNTKGHFWNRNWMTIVWWQGVGCGPWRLHFPFLSSYFSFNISSPHLLKIVIF